MTKIDYTRYYRKTPIREFDVYTTMYDQIIKMNQNNLNEDALGYMGNNIKYRELIRKINELAGAYEKAGIKEGDIVPICTINTPEVAQILLALNKLGATSKWVDLRSTNEQLIKYINESESKMFIGLNILMPRIEKLIKETDLKKVISISPTESIRPLKVLLHSLKDFKKLLGEAKKRANEPKIVLPNDERFVAFNEFINTGKGAESSIVSFDKERPTVIVQSSGTTGMAKSIVHSDFSINSSVYNLSYSDYPFYIGNTILTTVPPWVAYGLINSIYLALAFGMKAELCPKVDKDVVFNNLGKFELAFAAPLHYRYIAENIDKIKPKDLEKIVGLITGGDKIEAKELDELEYLLGKKIYNGYGSNEVLGAAATNPFNENHHGTVGIPLYNNEILAFDVTSGEKLGPNEQGELCIKTSTIFKEYAGKIDETKEIKMERSDGTWMRTGDLGYLDEEGFIHISGRLKRVIIRAAFKIYPGTIEEIIDSHYAVEKCVVVGVNDPEEISVPYAFIVVKSEYESQIEKIETEIKEKCNQELKKYEQPKYISFIKAIPYTQNNKQDYRKLERMGEEITNQGMALKFKNHN